MRHLIYITFFLTLVNVSSAQTTKEQKFKAVATAIIAAFSNHDSLAVSKYINKNIGVYQLDKVGAFDHYNNFKTVSFSDSSYPKDFFRQSKNIKLSPLKYGKLPAWNCEEGTWSKKGLFVDTVKTDHLLSTIAKNRNKYVPDHIPNKTIQSFYEMENKSRRIVLYDNNNLELVFYLSYLNGNWFLIIIDNVSSDCSV